MPVGSFTVNFVRYSFYTMSKFSLTPTGVEAFTAELYKLGNDRLQTEAVLVAEDTRSYIAANFEMPVHQLELLRNLNDSFVYILGWSLAVALLNRRPVTYSILNDVTEWGHCKNSCILLSSQFAHHLDENGVSTTGKLIVQV